MNKHEGNQFIKTEHAFQHNIYLKKMHFDKGNLTYRGHHHGFDHVTLVASGRVRVKFGAVPEANLPEEVHEYGAVSMFVTRSFREHEITSLEDNTTVCCVHAIRMKDGEIIDPPSELSERTLTSFGELSQAIGGLKLDRLAFDLTPEEKQQQLERAKAEGTLVANSGNMLL